jgi:hypothetical protein
VVRPEVEGTRRGEDTEAEDEDPDTSESRARSAGGRKDRVVPTASIAGQVPRAKASIVSIPSPTDAVLAARAANA